MRVYFVGNTTSCRRCGKDFVVQVRAQQLCHAPCVPRSSGPPDKAATARERGYNREHRQQRRLALAAWQDGDPCARCESPMYHGTPVDMDHTDDRTGWLGLSHRSCNRSHTGRLDCVKRPAVCDHCGLLFTTQHLAQRFCTVVCRKAAPRPARPVRLRKAKPAKPRECRQCGTRFVPSTGGQMYCGSGCSTIKCAHCDRRLKRTRTTRVEGEAICHPCRPDHPQTNRPRTGPNRRRVK